MSLSLNDVLFLSFARRAWVPSDASASTAFERLSMPCVGVCTTIVAPRVSEARPRRGGCTGVGAAGGSGGGAFFSGGRQQNVPRRVVPMTHREGLPGERQHLRRAAVAERRGRDPRVGAGIDEAAGLQVRLALE